jgi:hypothetical protein
MDNAWVLVVFSVALATGPGCGGAPNSPGDFGWGDDGGGASSSGSGSASGSGNSSSSSGAS